MTLITGLPAAQAYDRENDYLAIRQTTAATDKTRRIQGKKITEEVENSITTLTATVEDIEDIANAAIPLTQKGVANGVATLDASGKVPASQLNLSGLSFKGDWNATSNTPSLADGSGTAGDYYIVNTDDDNDFARNLGSGSVDWSPNAYILYNGTKWIENEAVDRVGSVNGMTGAVVLDADDIDATASKEYVTPDQRAAADAADAPDASNPFVTTSALNTAIAAISDPGIVVIGGYYTPDNYNHPDFDGGTGENKILQDLGITQAQAEARWPLAQAMYGGSIDVTTTSLDDVRFASWLEGAKYGIIYDLDVLPNKAYAFNKGNLRIPAGKENPINNTDSQQYLINFKSSLYKNHSGAPFSEAMFYRTPSSQTDANSNYLDNRWCMTGGKFEGVDLTDICFKFGATRSGDFRNMEMQNFGTAFEGSLLLNADFHKVNTASCTTGLRFRSGWWSGANVNNSITQATLHRCRHRLDDTDQIGVKVEAFDTFEITSPQFEGTNARYAISIDVNSGATTNKFFSIRNMRCEMGNNTKFTSGLVGYRGKATRRLVIDTVFSQDAAAGDDTILLDCENTQGTMNYKIAGLSENTGSGSFKLRQTNSGGAGSYTFEDAQFLGRTTVANPTGASPTTAAQHIDATNYAVWTDDSELPPLQRVTVMSPFKA